MYISLPEVRAVVWQCSPACVLIHQTTRSKPECAGSWQVPYNNGSRSKGRSSPEMLPLRPWHSDRLRHVPLSPLVPVHSELGKVTTWNKLKHKVSSSLHHVISIRIINLLEESFSSRFIVNFVTFLIWEHRYIWQNCLKAWRQNYNCDRNVLFSFPHPELYWTDPFLPGRGLQPCDRSLVPCHHPDICLQIAKSDRRFIQDAIATQLRRNAGYKL